MERRAFPSDPTDRQWALIEPLIPPKARGGRPRSVDMREVVNGLLYLNRHGGTWRALPHEFPKWQLVYQYFCRFQNDGTWEKIHDVLRAKVRKQAGHRAEPSAAIIDRQTVKTTEKRGDATGTTRGRRSRAANAASSSARSG